MASALGVFGRNDLRSIWREPTLIALMCAPLGWIVMARVFLPPVEAMLWRNYRLDLEPYYPLVLVGLLLLTSPIVVGGLAAFMMLDERDARTLSAVRVSPMPLGRFIGYRGTMAVIITAIYTVASMYGSGMVPLSHLPGLIVVGFGNGACGLLFCLLILSLARNKVEGLAVLRGTALVLAGLPLIAYFLDMPVALSFGLIPTYWPAQAYWTIAEGGVWWPYVVAGVVYNALLAWPLYRRFLRSV